MGFGTVQSQKWTVYNFVTNYTVSQNTPPPYIFNNSVKLNRFQWFLKFHIITSFPFSYSLVYIKSGLVVDNISYFIHDPLTCLASIQPTCIFVEKQKTTILMEKRIFKLTKHSWKAWWLRERSNWTVSIFSYLKLAFSLPSYHKYYNKVDYVTMAILWAMVVVKMLTELVVSNFYSLFSPKSVKWVVKFHFLLHETCFGVTLLYASPFNLCSVSCICCEKSSVIENLLAQMWKTSCRRWKRVAAIVEKCTPASKNSWRNDKC